MATSSFMLIVLAFSEDETVPLPCRLPCRKSLAPRMRRPSSRAGTCRQSSITVTVQATWRMGRLTPFRDHDQVNGLAPCMGQHMTLLAVDLPVRCCPPRLACSRSWIRF
jgi:hypothetical protein